MPDEDIAILYDRYIRYPPHSNLRIICVKGIALKISIRPIPTLKTSVLNPILIPSMWGKVLRKPKLVPEAISIILFGPGVIEATNAKIKSAKITSMLINSIINRIYLEYNLALLICDT